MKGIGLELGLSMGTSTPAENAVFLLKPCSTLLLRTVQNSGNCSAAQYAIAVSSDAIP
jgi:hypothetical protein